jgi:hypothetical protein
VLTFDDEMERVQTFLIPYDDAERAMLTGTLKLFIRDVLDVCRRAEQFLVSLGAERRCAMRLDRLSERLLAMGERIDMLRSRLRGGVDEAIDADGALRDSLKGLKEDISGIRCQLGSMRKPQLGARLQRAFVRLGKVAAHTYARADKLQWEIDEHDQRYSQ